MMIKQHPAYKNLKNTVKLAIFKLNSIFKQKFECPICEYVGPFEDIVPSSGLRKHAVCPKCRALERHRLQYLVLAEVLRKIRPEHMKMLHFAPEKSFRGFFSQKFGAYETADLDMAGVDHHVDLTALPFNNESYDFVFASHVLEHVKDDDKAISEIRRVLKPGGLAILPVPIISVNTVEYPEPNPNEIYHVRAPGLDYFNRFDRYFARVEKFSSESFPEKYQLYIYEDRSIWPTRECPLRPAMLGEKHIDIVPVCYA